MTPGLEEVERGAHADRRGVARGEPRGPGRPRVRVVTGSPRSVVPASRERAGAAGRRAVAASGAHTGPVVTRGRAVGEVGPAAAEPLPARTRATTVSRGLVVTTLLASPLLAGAGPAVLWVVVAAGLLAGVPHGAVDHQILCRTGSLPAVPAAVGYAGVAAAAWAVLVVTGVPGLVAVVALSVLHFGLGELEAWPGAAAAGRAVRTAVAAGATSALLLPLARGGDQVRAVAAALDPDLPGLLGAPAVRVGLVVVALGGAAVGLRHARRTADRGLATDLVLVVLLGALAPPLVAFAVWFGGWHAVRHTARLLVAGPRGRGPAGAGWFLRAAALPTAGALGVLAVLAAAQAVSPDPARTTALGLQLLLAVTVPHVLLVAWLDHRTARRPGPPAQPGPG